MITSSFDARIVNGQLVPADPLRALEGQQGHVVVSVPPSAELDALVEPPEEMDVEKDVYVRLALPSEMIANPIIAAGTELRPSLIFPEDLPDE